MAFPLCPPCLAYIERIGIIRIMNTRLMLCFFSLLPLGALLAGPQIPLPEGVESRISSPQVIVTPDRTDWTYAPGDKVTFTIEVRYDGQLLPGATVYYQIGPEKFLSDPVEVNLPGGHLVVGGGTLDQPGFLRCMARTEIQGRSYTGMATAAFSPLQIQPTQEEPEDFEAFWDRQLALLEPIPLQMEKTLLPDRCTSEVNVYAVRYMSWGMGRPVPFYGILCEPAKGGTYPAVLRVPGAGVRPYAGNIRLAAKGVIYLEIGIHGIPVTMEGSVYEDLRNAALYGYNRYNLDDPYKYYYRRVYLGCVRANDVLTSHPMWDGANLVVCGGSQGGQLSIVTSALDARVTGTVSNYPAYCDVTGYVHDRAGGWPHLFRDEAERTPEKLATTAYYDALNFARRLHAPISMAFGYNDVTCPPTSMYAAYNVIPIEKELHLQLEMGHRSSDQFTALFEERILQAAGAE